MTTPSRSVLPRRWHTSLGLSIIIKLTYKLYKLHGLLKTVDNGANIGQNIRYNDIEAYTDIAIKLHEFQYNGLDKSGEVNSYPSLDFVKMDLEKLLKEIEKYLVGNP
jgi:hypothetical protein